LHQHRNGKVLSLQLPGRLQDPLIQAVGKNDDTRFLTAGVFAAFEYIHVSDRILMRRIALSFA
jgi:hypothetical protein